MFSPVFYDALLIGFAALGIGIPTAIPWVKFAKENRDREKRLEQDISPTVTFDQLHNLYPINPAAWTLYPYYVLYNTRTGDEANAKPEEIISLRLSKGDLKQYKSWIKELVKERDAAVFQNSSTAKRRILLEQWGRDMDKATERRATDVSR